MRFVDFLRTSVLLCAASATVLAAVCVLSAGADSDDRLVVTAAVWWTIAAVIGAAIGRRAQTNSPIAKLLAEARSTNQLPQQRPGNILLNRLWPLLSSTLLGLAVGAFAPQVPAIGAGFAIVGALAWRQQEGAVTAIEERDGVAFYVEPTSPLRPMKLVRAPGFRRDMQPVDSPAG